jgi:hypothetical protein
MAQRSFTVSEVNALLPRIEVAARLMQEGTIRLRELSERLFKEGRPVSDTLVDADYAAVMGALMRGAEIIGDLGGQVKDMATGLVDFPSRRRGRAVLLCWRLGEARVGSWHEADAGFAGRTAIEDEAEFEGDGGADPSSGIH